MTTDEKLLETMLERVANPASDTTDHLAAQMFCMIVQNNSELVTKAHELIVSKIRSTNITEANRAIGVLELCMSKGGLEFQKKTAKFTFLNELIALVLDKHPGTHAPVETKKRIMECLMLWTVEHQDKLKIQETYENLSRQVNFSHGPSTANSCVREQRPNILGKDNELVAKLLKQGGDENHKKANLLIKHRVDQDTRRSEFISHLKSELKKIESTMELLNEMLNSYSSDASGADSRDIIQELYNSCKGHSEQMSRWPDFLGSGEPAFLEDVLNTKDQLMDVIQNYKKRFENEVTSTKLSNMLSTKSTDIITTTNTDLLSELLGETITATGQHTNLIKANDNTTVNDLNEIFGRINDNVEINNKPHHPADLFGNLDLLQPTSIFESPTKDVDVNTGCCTAIMNEKDARKTQGFKELKEIDKLSEELFLQNLKEEKRLQSFKKETGKITLNDMAKDTFRTSLKTPLKYEEKKTLESDFDADTNDIKEKDQLETLANIKFPAKVLDIKKEVEHQIKPDCTSIGPLKHLAEISVDLDEVTPLDEGQRLLLDDDDIHVTLTFTADRPSEHVSVIVMVVTNKSKLPIKDFQFEASVKKPCKVRLLPPTDVKMAPSKPFRPSAPINQVVLLLNPTHKAVDVTCIVGYKLGDDPDPIKESIVVKDIPFV